MRAHPVLVNKASSWLPNGAAGYAVQLNGPQGKKGVHRFSSASVGEVVFDNQLSKRLLLDWRMKKVWMFLSHIYDKQNDDNDDWQDWVEFIAEVQFAARGPESVGLRSPSEKSEDLNELKIAFQQIRRICNRYGIDITQLPVGSFFKSPSLETVLREPANLSKVVSKYLDDDAKEIPEFVMAPPDDLWTVQGGNRLTLPHYFSELKGLISRRQSLIKKPGHHEIQYQFFVRRIYLYFKEISRQPNKWTILAIIASVALEKEIEPYRVRGTCKDLV